MAATEIHHLRLDANDIPRSLRRLQKRYSLRRLRVIGRSTFEGESDLFAVQVTAGWKHHAELAINESEPINARYRSVAYGAKRVMYGFPLRGMVQPPIVVGRL